MGSEMCIRDRLNTDGNELIQAKAEKNVESVEQAREILEIINDGGRLEVEDLTEKPGTRRPGAPFTTSSLQITASNKIGFSPKRTMGVAQALYQAGHITYMRTDSIHLASEARAAIKTLVVDRFGEDHYQHRVFKTKDANAQEAHEAIRPTKLHVDEAGKDESERKPVSYTHLTLPTTPYV